MASFFDTNINTGLLNLVGQNQARAAALEQGAVDRIGNVGSIFRDYARSQDEARQRGIENQRQADILRLRQNQDTRAAEQLLLDQDRAERDAQTHLLNMALKDPTSPEAEALRKAKLDDFESQKEIEARFRPKKTEKPRLLDMFKQNPDGSIRTVKATPEEARIFAGEGFQLGGLSNVKKPGGGSEGSSGTSISKIIGSSGNPKEVTDAYNKFKAAGGSDKQFLRRMFELGAADMNDKGLLDFGKKDIDVSPILKQLEQGGTAPTTPTTTTPTLSEPKQFTLPTTGATALRNEIVSDINSLRNPLFGLGTRKIESAIKEEIDAKYGEGAYEATKAFAK